MPTEVAAAIAWVDGRLLLTRRAAGQKLAGYWELPGGKLEPGETVQSCIERELLEELGVASKAEEIFTNSIYTYPGGSIDLIAIYVRLESQDFELVVHDAVTWAEPANALKLQLAPADIPIVRMLQDRSLRENA